MASASQKARQRRDRLARSAALLVKCFELRLILCNPPNASASVETALPAPQLGAPATHQSPSQLAQLEPIQKTQGHLPIVQEPFFEPKADRRHESFLT